MRKGSRLLRLEAIEDRRLLTALTVTTDQDTVDSTDGALSLREAVLAANQLSDENLIEFDFSGLPPAPSRTINLALGQLSIINPLTIDGSGVNNDLGWENLTIDAGGNSRIFSVQIGGSNAQSVTITDLSLTDGSAGNGGAINAAVGVGNNAAVHSLALDKLRVYGNEASGSGGGIEARVGGNDHLTITNSLVELNEVDEPTGRGYGGGVYVVNGGGTIMIDRLVSIDNTMGLGGVGGGLAIGGL